MECPRCRKRQKKRVILKEVKRKGGFHKQTKFKCPNCGFIRMKANQ